MNDPKLEGWNKYYHVIFENLSIVEKFVNKQSEKDYIREFINDYPPERVLQIKQAVKFERIEFSLTFLTLYSLRNKIVHEGLNYVNYLPIYIDKLRKILEVCLTSAISEVCNISSDIKTIDEFLEFIQKPF